MNNEKENLKKEEEVLSNKTLTLIIPECCREGWDSCTHCVKPQKKVKRNVGL